MANFLDKLKIKTALEDRVKLDLGCDHITTANFMQFNVAYSKEMVPKEKISVNMETFTRLNPMPVPTFGRAKINNRAFFVPFRTIMPAWNEFITDTTYSDTTTTIVSQVPLISNDIFLQVFFRDDLQVDLPYSVEVNTREESDFVFIDYSDDEEPVERRMQLTAEGRQALKVLQSLGYNIIPEQDLGITYSALPLMAMAKVYVDWYFPSAYVNNAFFTRVQGLFNHRITNLTTTQVQDLLSCILWVNYDSDYFVSAWDNPVAPNTGSYSSAYINDVTVDDDSGVGYVSNNVTSNGTPTLSGTIAQFGLDALKSLTDYMKRHQLVGARALDRYLARFGVNLSSEKLKRSVYIGSGSENIQFGDVMSTADTDGAALGNYAGKGIGYGASNFEFETDEYGLFIIVSSIVPRTGYYQGINRNVMHISRTDFWTPEFDNLGTQAIGREELYVPTNGSSFDFSDYAGGVFGWTPRYAEYKVGRDMLTGDFRCNSINTGQEAWHTMREVSYTDSSDIVHNFQFVTGQDAGQYSRIFYNTDADAADKFNVIYHFEIASWSPMKSLFDTYEFDSKGKSVLEDVNGVKMN